MLTLTTNKARFEELKKNPLLFLVKENLKNELWRATNKDFKGYFSSYDIKTKLGYLLMIADCNIINGDANKSANTESITFEIYAANPANVNHWITIINSYIYRSKNKEDKYPFIHLLWFISHYSWTTETLREAIRHYDTTIQPFVFKILSKIGQCLSCLQQERLSEVLGYFNIKYNIYYPAIIPNALSKITPKVANQKEWNLFKSVDYILGCDEDMPNFTGPKRKRETDTSNPLLSLYHWFNDENLEFDHKALKPLFSIISLRKRFNLVKRYLHDIRLKKVELDTTLLEEFKDNTFSDFIRYRYCIYTPEAPINLSVSLLCDCLSTIEITKGKSFQSFDGVLDFAINHCDVTKPDINLGLEFFIPKCNGGAIYNSNFLGFIDYGYVCKLDKSRLNETSLLSFIYSLLETRARRIVYDGCSIDGTPLTSGQLVHCKKTLGNNFEFSCARQMYYKDRWHINSQDINWANLFLTEPITVFKERIEITANQISAEVFADNINKIADRYKIRDTPTYFLKSEDLDKIEIKLLYELSKPVNIRIFPRTQVLIGAGLDVLGICDSMTVQSHQEYCSKEMETVLNRVIDSLTKELSTNYNGDFFEIPFDEVKLHDILNAYYYKRPTNGATTDSNKTFLCKYSNINKQFCAPKLAETHNRATGFPFFWCRGKECFSNGLDKHVLENCNDWKKYSLYHLIEIMGYPKLHKVEGGYEPDEIINKFIAIANKVVKKFNKLRCRHCGHLMGVVKNVSFNRYNYYSCFNPTCEQYKKEVYLNFCFKCKKGLIDSRDHVQCPNGWYICPDCLSCCDDAQYERIAQKYIISNKQIPNKIASMLNSGHNNKGIYFCHHCGTQVKRMNDRDESFLWCDKCKTRYDI